MEMRQCANCGMKLRAPKGEKWPSLLDLREMFSEDQNRQGIFQVDYWIKVIKIKPTSSICDECFWK